MADPRERPALDLVSHSSLHTERLGERLGRSARPNDVFALWGELGAGKTVLAKDDERRARDVRRIDPETDRNAAREDRLPRAELA